jgi:POT family proton-dependent oligopeptide transporter
MVDLNINITEFIMSITNQLRENSLNIREARNGNMPKFLAILFFAEMWERFSYYGMRALLVLCLISELGFEDAKAYAVYSLFCAIGYAGPVISGYLADKLMGFRNMVVIGGVIMTIGNALMTLVVIDPELIYLGLGFVAIGTGMFKGNITSLLGSCYKEDDRERDRGFTLFYVSVNIGAFFASIACGYVAHLYGWHYGFGLAGVGMAIGTATFITCQHILGDSGAPTRPDLMERKFLGLKPFTLLVIGCLILAFGVSKMLMASEFFANVLAIFGSGILVLVAYIISKLPSQEKRDMIALSIMIFFLMCFFALEMQLGSLINVFTDRNVAGEVFGITVPAAVSQALNPLSVILLGAMLGTCMKFNQKYAMLQCAIGLGTMVACFLVLYLGCLEANENGKVGYIYLVISMAFMSLGELCIAPLIQAQTTLLSPKHLRGFMMGVYMLSLAFANLLGIVLAKFMSVPSVDGVVDPLQSLEIYREGFLHITAFNLGVVAVFLLFFPFLHKVVTRK